MAEWYPPLPCPLWCLGVTWMGIEGGDRRPRGGLLEVAVCARDQIRGFWLLFIEFEVSWTGDVDEGWEDIWLFPRCWWWMMPDPPRVWPGEVCDDNEEEEEEEGEERAAGGGRIWFDVWFSPVVPPNTPPPGLKHRVVVVVVLSPSFSSSSDFASSLDLIRMSSWLESKSVPTKQRIRIIATALRPRVSNL